MGFPVLDFGMILNRAGVRLKVLAHDVVILEGLISRLHSSQTLK